jgi:hypothetical protein
MRQPIDIVEFTLAQRLRDNRLVHLINMEKVMESALSIVQAVRPEISDEAQRLLCFELFNSYWDECHRRGIDFDTIGTMSISAALFAIVASHGVANTADFLDDLAAIVRAGEFNLPRPPSH